MSTTVATLVAKLAADTTDFDRGMKRSESRMGKVGTAAKVGLAAGVGVAVVALKSSVGAAMDAEKAEMRLGQAFDSAKVSAGARKKAQEEVNRVSKQAALDDEDLSDVLAKLTRSTGDVGKAQEGMALSAEIARGRNISLEAASKAVEKAMLGQDQALKRIGVTVPKVDENYKALKDKISGLQDQMKTAEGPAKERIRLQIEELKATSSAARELDKMATANNALAKAQDMFAGSSKEFGETSAGAHERFQVAVENLQESIGKLLLPAITDLTNAGLKGIEWMQENERVAKILIIAIGALTTALVLAKVAQLLLNLAVLANPYVAAAVAVGVLVAALVILWQKYEDLRILIIAFVARFSPLGAAILLVKDNFGLLEGAMDKVKAAVVWLKDNIGDPFTEALSAKIGTVKDAINVLATVVGKVVDGITWLKNNIGDPFSEALSKKIGAVKEAFDPLVAVLGKVKDAIEWLIDNIGDIPKPDLGKLDPRNWDLPFRGDPRDPRGGGPHSISSQLWDELAGARRFGLTLTSGYRPGAITANGTPSDHGVFPSKAIDVAGTPSAMAGFFRWLIGQPDVKQAFYDPLGSIFGGILSTYREGGHSDHVHVATYDQGGFLRPGWNLAYNGLGRPEPVGAAIMGGPQQIVVQLGDTTLARLIRDAKGRYEQRNGPGSF